MKRLSKLLEDKLLYGIIFLAFIFVLGVMADRNLYRLKFYDEKAAAYDYLDHEKDIISEYTISLPFMPQMVDLNGLVRRIAGQREMNSVTKLNNGYLTQVTEEISDERMHGNAQAVIDYNEYCKEHGVTLLYVSPAYKISKWDEQLPTGVTDGKNATIDKMLKELNEAGVNTLDLRECMHEDGIDPYDMYYVTDHHWNTEGAFYGYTKIAEWIAEHTGTELDESLLDLDNYQIDTYKNWHLGMWGQETGTLYAGIDDFDLITPSFPTFIYNSETGETGSVDDEMISYGLFEDPDFEHRYTYDGAYSKADINTLTSLEAASDLNVLMLSDSYSQGLKMYMMLTYKDFRITNYYNLRTSLLDTYDTDVVVIMPWAGNFSEKSQLFYVNYDAE